MARLPKPYQNFQKKYNRVWTAYEELGAAVHTAGPLDEKTRELVKLALAVGAQLEGATHSHTRRALAAGASAAEIRQVVLLAIPTIGFPRMMAALSWVDDLLTSAKQ
jgi:4-carboxymuconolactone decarboxylase